MRPHAWHCESLLTPEGWRQDVTLHCNGDGLIARISENRSAGATPLPGPVVPGMVNVHSHAHQRLIAGLTGRTGGSAGDSFWSWREQMYRAIDLLSADDLELVASYLYAELLAGGYTSIGEFHYAHRLGRSTPPASNQALLRAAEGAGCAITLLPVWYRYADFGRRPPTPAQRRFVQNLDELLDLVGWLDAHIADRPLQKIGVAPHSLRAVDVDDLPALVEALPDRPCHLHVAEQRAEVRACLDHFGRRPVALLHERDLLGPNWCLIHATHAHGEEIRAVADSGAVVGLCPTTEADLGDGLFPTNELIKAGGRFAIGSDSNLHTNAATELGLLEWTERLKSGQRNVLPPFDVAATGRWLWQQASRAGAQALAQPAGALEPGRRADFVVLDAEHALLAGLDADRQLDTWLMTQRADLIAQVHVAGQCRVERGRHHLIDELRQDFIDLRGSLIRHGRP